MFEDFTLTSYAPAARFTNGQLQKQNRIISRNELLVNLINSISQMVVILNQFRQIVYANKSYYEFCGATNMNPLIGKRPGETLQCINATLQKGGCGTSEFCKSCGSVNAIIEASKGVKSTKECKILTSDNKAYEFKVTATPFMLDGEKLTVFSLIDISSDKRKETLERIFIHDILNSAGGISGLSSILTEIDDPKEMKEIAETISQAAGNLINDIKMQREIGAAERGDLNPEFEKIESQKLLKELVDLYSNHELNTGKPVKIHPDSQFLTICSDKNLLKRVLGNMIRNAAEVLTPNDAITLDCRLINGSILFSVHNKSYIQPEVQCELFKRTYSTKGRGRGLGTYSMKLLGEKYLKGKVWFESDLIKGTTFYFQI